MSAFGVKADIGALGQGNEKLRFGDLVGLCGSIQTKRVIPPQLGQPGRSDAAGTEIVGDALIGFTGEKSWPTGRPTREEGVGQGGTETGTIKIVSATGV